MKTIIILVIALLIFSGCLNTAQPRFNLEQSEKLDFNPASFEVIKKWNQINQDKSEFALDNCNMAYRIDPTTWQINLKKC